MKPEFFISLLDSAINEPAAADRGYSDYGGFVNVWFGW